MGSRTRNFEGGDREGGLQTHIFGCIGPWGARICMVKFKLRGYFLFYRQISDKNVFLVRFRQLKFLGVDGDKVYLDTLLHVISLRYRLTITSWKNPEILRHQSRKFLKSLVILMKNVVFTPFKIWCIVSNLTDPSELNYGELEYAVFLPNLLTTFFLICTSLYKIFNKILAIDEIDYFQ